MGEIKKITTANMYIGKEPAILVAEAVGTCVAITMWDSTSHIGGMVEIMLPDCLDEFATFTQISQYADTGIPELIRRMRIAGANPERLEAKIAGGATLGNMHREAGIGNIGANNIIAVKRYLEAYGVTLVSEDIGGEFSRRILFYPANGEIVVQIPDREDKVM